MEFILELIWDILGEFIENEKIPKILRCGTVLALGGFLVLISVKIAIGCAALLGKFILGTVALGVVALCVGLIVKIVRTGSKQ